MTARPPHAHYPDHRPTWPLWHVLPDMGALITAPRTARAQVRDILRVWELTRFEENAVLIASELITNVVRQCHDPDGTPVYIGGRLPVIQLSLFSDRARLMIAVYDQVPGTPQERHPADDAETGRGLELIAMLGTWDWHPVPGGKVIRALLAAAP